ncbi:hypothetical protein ALQ77_200007 [Pseudomonas corrugata]|uniref:Uncharacterized protein n=1 Tax=Pseudomonas corrugata TaxID=47879 RepID=A0A3M3EZN8_9PSED|nr:hypothetical protein ALQ77_200007 [Pseudomonas corrugata]
MRSLNRMGRFALNRYFGLARPYHRFFSDKPRLAASPAPDKFTNFATT